MTIFNGDVFDIGQTVNGVSRFIYYNNKWHYYRTDMTREYEYDQKDLTDLVSQDYDTDVTYLGNIFSHIADEKNKVASRVTK